MKILMIHKFLYLRGGAERYLFNLSEYMSGKGHAIIFFSMQHEQNQSSEYSQYFVSNIDFNQHHSVLDMPRQAGRVIYSQEARDKISILIEHAKPDVAFIHNIYHHLSPSILGPLAERKIPTILHIADYKLICPNYKLLSHGKICQACKGARFHNVVSRRCIKSSAIKSALASVEMYVHRLTKIYEKNVDAFICPSLFLKNKLVEFGFPPEKLFHIPQAMSINGFEPTYTHDGYIIYFGRLVQEKGVGTLIQAMEMVNSIQLVVVGDGPHRPALERYVDQKGLDNVSFVGFQSGENLSKLVRNAMLAVVPSEWYEVFGLSIYEAFSFGKPVIGARIGAIPELVRDGVTGLLFEPADHDNLASKIRFLVRSPEKIYDMGKNARQLVENEFSPSNNYRSIISLYKKIQSRC